MRPVPQAARAAACRIRSRDEQRSFADSRNPRAALARRGRVRAPRRPRWPAGPALRDACIELHGPLGAGKTTFVRHLLRALGVQGRVKSPTYAVVEPYELPGSGDGPRSRTSTSTASTIRRNGKTPAFATCSPRPGLKLVEWPEKAAGLLPEPDLRLHIDSAADEHRRVRWSRTRRVARSCCVTRERCSRAERRLRSRPACRATRHALAHALDHSPASPSAAARCAARRLGAAARRARARVRRQHRRGPRLAGGRLHARDDRVRHAAGAEALPGRRTRTGW